MNMIGCKTCGLVQGVDELQPDQIALCARCRSEVHRAQSNSRIRTAAFSFAALCLYVPANIYPMMTMEYLGRSTQNTVWGGVRALYEDGMVSVALLVFAASIIIPLLKLFGLFFLVSTWAGERRALRTWIYRIISRIGPWAMLDVFLLSIIAALIRFGKFATIIPGPGIFAFAAVVVLTLLASASFDPRIIWQNKESEPLKQGADHGR